jgi:hypothetical protein
VISNAEHFLAMIAECMAAVPSKAIFCRTRMSQAEKLARLSGKESTTASADAAKVLDDTMRFAEDLTKAADEVAASVSTRFNSLVAFNPSYASEMDRRYRTVTDSVTRIKSEYAAVVASLEQPLPALPPPERQAGGKRGGHMAKLVATVPTPSPLPAAQAPPPTHAAAAHAPAPVATPASVAAPDPAPSADSASETAVSESAAPAKKAATVVPSRQWGKVDTPTAADVAGDNSLPTPAEAFKTEDGFNAVVSKKKNRKKDSA